MYWCKKLYIGENAAINQKEIIKSLKRKKWSMGTYVITLSENELFDSNNFILENYYFYKWNTEPDGSGISYKNLALTNELEFKEGQDSIELYAQWSSIIPITISKENYQTVLQDLENTIGKQYLFYCIDELSADMFEVIKNAIYNLFEVNIYLDFSSVTCRTSIEFRDRD